MGKSLAVLPVGTFLFCSYTRINVTAGVLLTSQCPAIDSSLCKVYRWFQIYRTAPCKHAFFALAFRDHPRSYPNLQFRQSGFVTSWSGALSGRVQ